MSSRVVCISRTLGAGGETIGRFVAERLGFRYVDEAIIALASDKAKVDPGRVAEAEHRKPLLERVLDALAANTSVEPVPYVPPAPEGLYYHSVDVNLPLPALRPDFRALIREVIGEIAVQGRVVIVAHAASIALTGTAGVLRVLVTASEKTRAERLVAAKQASDEKEAQKLVKQSDRERREYLRDFYEIKEELPTNYDLVINTDALSATHAASIVIHAASS